MKRNAVITFFLAITLFIPGCATILAETPAPSPTVSPAGITASPTDIITPPVVTSAPTESLPLTVDYATEEVLTEYDCCEKAVSDTAAVDPQYAVDIIITTSAPLRDFRFHDGGIVSDGSPSGRAFSLRGTPYAAPELLPDKPLVVSVVLADVPRFAVSYVDDKGDEKCYAISCSGPDSSLGFTELPLVDPHPPTLTAVYAAPELLAQYGSYDAVVSATKDIEFFSEIIISTSAPLKSFRILDGRTRETDGPELSLYFEAASVAYSVDEFPPDRPILLTLSFPSILAWTAVSYVDENGVERCYCIYSGNSEGSPLFLNEIPLGAPAGK